MISGKMENLFAPNARKILLAVSFFAGFICLMLVRFSYGDILKITWLYVMYMCGMIFIVLHKNSINKYEIAIFCFLCIQLFALAPSPDSLRGATISITYLLSYRYGVSSRSFIATIVDFFTRGGFVSRQFIWHFIFSGALFLLFTISAYLGTLIQKAKDDVKYFLIFLSLLWLSCFTAPSAYFPYINFGRIEMFSLIIIFVTVFVINKPVFRLIIPLLAVFIMATHLVLVFFYIPFIIILLLYGIFEKQNKDKPAVFLLIATIIALLTMFLLYLLFREGTFVFENARVFYDYLSARTNLNIDEATLHALMFASLEDHLSGWRSMVGLSFSGNFSIIINLPLILLFIAFWLKCFHHETQKLMKLFFLMPVFVFLYHAIAFFLFWDFARWMIMILNVQFLLVFYLISVRNSVVLSVVQNVTPFVKRNAFFVVLAYMAMLFLGPVQNIGPNPNIGSILRTLVQFIGL